MNKSEIINQAKYYFGKDRQPIKEFVLSYVFDDKIYLQWKKELSKITSHPIEIQHKIFNSVVLNVKNNDTDQIDWNWIGDLSWTFNILLNEDVDKGYDWDIKLASKCKGTAKFLTIFISEVLPYFTYDCNYEYGPITKFSKNEKLIFNTVLELLKSKGFQYLNKSICKTKHKELCSDINSDGYASLFDVLFSDSMFYTTKIIKYCYKDIIEKNGQKFRWKEYCNKNGTLIKRMESRWTNSGDYFMVTIDKQGQILSVDVTRKNIENEKFKHFKLDINKEFLNEKVNNNKIN